MKTSSEGLSLQQSHLRLARLITQIENASPGSFDLLETLSIHHDIPVIGITGSPGAGKSTLLNALVDSLLSQNKKIAVLAVDPASPFHSGAFLGDRIRFSKHFNHPGLFFRSLSSRGALGGIAPRTAEIIDALKSWDFDFIFIETIGVGQSEIEIARLVDLVILVTEPGSGDEIQAMKAGVIEIADIIVVNKADLPEARQFYNALKSALSIRNSNNANAKPYAIVKTIATGQEGIEELLSSITHYLPEAKKDKKTNLLVEKAIALIMECRMRDINREKIKEHITREITKKGFNIYKFVKNYYC